MKKLKKLISLSITSTTYTNGLTKIDGQVILSSRDKLGVTTVVLQKNDLHSDDTGRSKDKSLTTGAELRERRSTTRPNSDRVLEGTNRSKRGPSTSHRK